MSGRWIDGSVRTMNGWERQSEKGEEEKKSSLCAESCSDEINRCNGLVQMEDRRGQGELGKKMKTITPLHPPRGFWEKVRGCHGWVGFISEALLALKFWTLVPAFIASDRLSHNPCSPAPFPFFSFLYLEVSQSRCMPVSTASHWHYITYYITRMT